MLYVKKLFYLYLKDRIRQNHFVKQVIKKKITVLIVAIIILISCKNDKIGNAYEINGIAKNIPDSTKVLLYLYPKTGLVTDSTIVINEEFQFTGNITRPRLVHLRIVNSKDNKTFWLENQKIDFIGEKGNFSKSQIIGSDTQKESEILLKRKDSIFKEMNRINGMITDKNKDSLFIIYEKMIGEEVEINKNFIKDYPNSYESLNILSTSKERLGTTETDKLFSSLNKELQSTDEGKAIIDFIKVNKNPEVGEKYVDFEQPNTNGQPIRLSEIMGKYTLLEFWASNCGPCRAENPKLIKQYELYKDEGFVIVNVSLDKDKERWLKAVKKDGLTWENVSDLKGDNNEVAMIYGVRDIPDNFLIDENGIIIARYIRGENLKNKLKELFEKK